MTARPALALDSADAPRPSARVDRVMEMLDMDERTVRRLIDRGDLQAHGIGKRGIRVFLDSVAAYQESRTIIPKPLKIADKAQRKTVKKAAFSEAEAALRRSGILS